MAKKGSITYIKDDESTIPRALKKVYIPTAEFYSQVIDSLLDYAIFTIDNELTINSWNAGATGIFQYEPDEILGKPFHTIFSDTDISHGIPEKEVELSIKEGKATDNRWHICKDGKKIFAHGLVFALTGSDDEPLGFVKILRDITEMKRKEDAIDIHVKELETLNTHKESVISILSHDLRSPLAGFISLIDYTKTNLAEIDQTELQGILEILHSSAITELEQLDHLVEWGRIKYASETFFPVQTNLFLATKKVISLLVENILSKKINVTIDIPFDYIVFADTKMLHSTLQNLISNAIKFSHIEGAITVTVIRQENRSVIAVKDTGIGIAPEILDQLFTPSLTALSSRRSNNSSAGIGLLLSKHLVEKHKGEIWAESKEGEGASFFFSLPDQCTASN
jgi:PAS domain S-box-containing protein